ncbi:DNA polymerase I [Candidatus Photodesmus katoptron Akat1]|uniref:DNA polymerase I n=1 Tax=Candidatus Photodesmus katoptron Akat1 TaxID=1236703 RepID=S3DJX7_9GAMM|nr:DNA polymerase I [Candidatus Photodesmus katoptron Akat1]
MLNIPDNPLILIDGSSYLYRAFYAYPITMNNGKIPTNAIYGVVNMLRSTMRQFLSERIAIIFDAEGQSFRSKMYPKYKANRQPMSEQLCCQIEPLKNVIQAMGIPLISVMGVEGDDVIGTLAVKSSKSNIPVLINTNDKDMAQLVNDNITLINTTNNEFMNRESVVKKFGIPPELIIDYLALTGDRSDNIPGVPGIGNKTATILLKKIGSLNDIFNNLNKVKSLNIRGSLSVTKKLENHKEIALLSYALSTIKLDVKLNETPQTLVKKIPNKRMLLELYKQLAFKSWLKEILEDIRN